MQPKKVPVSKTVARKFILEQKCLAGGDNYDNISTAIIVLNLLTN